MSSVRGMDSSDLLVIGTYIGVLATDVKIPAAKDQTSD